MTVATASNNHRCVGPSCTPPTAGVQSGSSFFFRNPAQTTATMATETNAEGSSKIPKTSETTNKI
eukprot:CAMPEP_0183579486 /NCGR_PEP_ID=MMETSP0371-20130417/143875_1 /TAXON_ID=268820 /ORGANISM="Peridinium aciculiferum, Strain PAER-2" /LENGTH=64 /DNA_ID=CAMNT_0025790001 /DNA_START=161 /DNA_END=352 /DNA_ORIENTATION=+